MKTRPIGITILAILLWLNTGSYLVLAGLAIVRRSSLLRLLHALSPSGAGPRRSTPQWATCCPCTTGSWLE
jgi:hypothetical protein